MQGEEARRDPHETLKRQQTIGPIIDYPVTDHSLDLCYLNDEICTQVHSLLFSTAANRRTLPRVIVRKKSKDSSFFVRQPRITLRIHVPRAMIAPGK